MPSKKPQLAFYGIWPDLKNYVRARVKGFPCAIQSDPLSAVNLHPDAEIVAVFVDTRLDKKILAKLPRLKMIATMSTGYDHIDLSSAKKRGIMVCNVPFYGENTVAEHALALILGLTRKLFKSVKRVKEGIYDFGGLRGMDLKDKTLGVVGTGHIGSQLIRMAKGLEMKVIAFDAFPNQKLARQYGFVYTSLEKLLARSDIISLHLPLLPSTHHLINKKNIKKIKKGAYLINTARGGLIEPEALVWALQNEQIAGAGIDVLEDENLLQHEDQILSGQRTTCELKTTLMNNIIIDHPNTIVTPHNAFNSQEAIERIIDTTIDNIKAFVAKAPQNVVGTKKT